MYCEEIHKTIFDLDEEKSPITNIGLLVEFDAPKKYQIQDLIILVIG